jgi:hypothetical protein
MTARVDLKPLIELLNTASAEATLEGQLAAIERGLLAFEFAPSCYDLDETTEAVQLLAALNLPARPWNPTLWELENKQAI